MLTVSVLFACTLHSVRFIELFLGRYVSIVATTSTGASFAKLRAVRCKTLVAAMREDQTGGPKGKVGGCKDGGCRVKVVQEAGRARPRLHQEKTGHAAHFVQVVQVAQLVQRSLYGLCRQDVL